MSADSWVASARRAAGAVHRPSVTVARVADPAAVDAFAVAAADVALLAARWAPPAAGDAVAAPAELQATRPTISTAEPAKSAARIPIPHRSISWPRVGIAPDVGARATERSRIAISAHSATLCDHDNVSIRVGR
jgi:hypothetical protein